MYETYFWVGKLFFPLWTPLVIPESLEGLNGDGILMPLSRRTPPLPRCLTAAWPRRPLWLMGIKRVGMEGGVVVQYGWCFFFQRKMCGVPHCLKCLKSCCPIYYYIFFGRLLRTFPTMLTNVDCKILCMWSSRNSGWEGTK